MSLPAPDLQSFAVAQEQVTQGAILQPHCERQLGTGVMVHPMRMSLWKKEKEKKKNKNKRRHGPTHSEILSSSRTSLERPTTTKETSCEKGCKMWDCFQMRICTRGPDPLSSPGCGSHSTHSGHLQSQASGLRSPLQVLQATTLFN